MVSLCILCNVSRGYVHTYIRMNIVCSHYHPTLGTYSVHIPHLAYVVCIERLLQQLPVYVCSSMIRPPHIRTICKCTWLHVIRHVRMYIRTSTTPLSSSHESPHLHHCPTAYRPSPPPPAHLQSVVITLTRKTTLTSSPFHIRSTNT